jgi:hypothetical protein
MFIPYLKVKDPMPRAPWYWLALIIAVGIFFGFVTQSLIGSRIPPDCGIGDQLQIWTAFINSYLQENAYLANALIITYAAIGDVVVLFLIIVSLWQGTSRPVLPLLFFLVLREVMQVLVSLPIAEGLIWRYPGFPSLFSHYNISTDFYFSAYVGINLLGNLELERFRITWLSALGLVFLAFEAFIDIVLRAHYTPDIYTSLIVAFFCYLVARPIVPIVDRQFKKMEHRYPYFLFFLIVLGVAAFYTASYYIGQMPVPECEIRDILHELLYPINEFLSARPRLEAVQLILMNVVVHGFVIFILVDTILTRNIRPFFTLAIFIALRQFLQFLVALPLPPDLIWYNPGIALFLETYDIANDLYFSGHTGISLLGAIELARFGKRWLTILGFTLFAYEVLSVLSMQIHYTMDVFTAVMTVFCFTGLATRLAPSINRWLTRHSWNGS